MKSITLYPLRDYVRISVSHITEYYKEDNDYMLHNAKFYNLLTGKKIKIGDINIKEQYFLRVKRDRVDDKHPNVYDCNQGPHYIYVKWHFIMSVLQSIMGYNSILDDEQEHYKERIHALAKTENDD